MSFKLKLYPSKLWLAPMLMFLFALATVSAHAQTGFNGTYDYSTWTSSNTLGNPTTSTIDGSQQTLVLYEPDDSVSGSTDGEQTFLFSHTVASSGLVSFDWNFNWDIDSCCSGFNFYVNSTLYDLADGYPGNGENQTTASGDDAEHFSVAVNQGDTISFGAYSADGCCGAATTTITNFDAGSGAPVPEPSSFALLLSPALAGLEVLRRRRLR
jgi:hypothetical protein